MNPAQRLSLKELSEFPLIGEIAGLECARADPGTVGIGDDCAVIPLSQSESLLVTTDSLLDGVHFLKDKAHPRDLGYKLLAVNLSDIAGMGGKPKEAFLSLAIPGAMPALWVREFLQGFNELALQSGVVLAGGNTNLTPHAFSMSLTLLGRAHPGEIKYRSQARSGDLIFVTGTLGDSAAGLDCILNERNSGSAETLLQRHYRPRPHLAEGQWLARQTSVHAMMDVSDGIQSDLNHILKSSQVGGSVRLPAEVISGDLSRYCEEFGLQAGELALRGGEDYCLLLTVSPDSASVLQEEFETTFGRPLFCMGRIDDENKGLRYET